MNTMSISRTLQRCWLVTIVMSLSMAIAVGCGGTSNSDGIVVKDGEVLLESARSDGNSSFTSEPYAGATGSDDAEEAFADAAAEQSVADDDDDESGAVRMASSRGDEPGLYGGTTVNSRCDRKLLQSFLKDNPDKARAWVSVFNDDDAFRWINADGAVRSYLSVTDIPDFLESLTPLILTRDTRVTNHGYRNGAAFPIQSVLQAGNAVLVDPFGVPRARCACGNPLLPPQAVTRSVRYVGKPWKRFRPKYITNITIVKVQINIFVVKDPDNPDETIEVAPGSNGTSADDGSSPPPDDSPSTDDGDGTSTDDSATDEPPDASDLGEETVIFDSGNVGGVRNGGSAARLTIDRPALITSISTYHWNDAHGSPAGTIYLKRPGGETVKSWKASPLDGQGGVPSAMWQVTTETFVEAGTYIVTDSDPATWATNDEAGGVGMTTIRGRYYRVGSHGA